MDDLRAINNNCISYFSADSDYHYELSWRIIAEKLMNLLKRGPKTTVTFEPLYSLIYRNVCNGNGEKMYLDLMSLCSRHVNEVEDDLCSPDDNSVEHFISVGEYAKNYHECIQKMALLFSYLNKNYVVYQLCSDLFKELAALFNRTILSHRIPTLMRIAEETLKVPCSFSPTILHRFFNDVNALSEGDYAKKYPELFARYCVRILPEMRECDLENHIREVREFQESQRNCNNPQPNQGLKRPLEEDDAN